MAQQRTCLIATSNLMTWSSLSGVARHAGLPPIQAQTVDAVVTAEDVAAVVVDLSDPSTGIEAVRAAAARDPVPAIIALGPHVHKELLEAAKEAGAQQVLPHSAAGVQLLHHLESVTKGD